MTPPLILIADSSPEFRQALSQALEGRFRMRASGNGREALDLLRQLQPDMLVLDLMLPELDGLSLLETALREGLSPSVLAVTPLLSGYILESLQALNVDYLLTKPCLIDTACARLEDMARHLHSRFPPAEIRAHIGSLLKSLSFSIRQEGWRCLVSAVALSAQRPGLALTKELYPDAGRLCCPPVSPELMEKRIRYSIQTAWDNGDQRLWRTLFPRNTAPTNAEFITRLAEELALWQQSRAGELPE